MQEALAQHALAGERLAAAHRRGEGGTEHRADVAHDALRYDVRWVARGHQVGCDENRAGGQVVRRGPDGDRRGRGRRRGLEADQHGSAGQERGEQAPVQQHPSAHPARNVAEPLEQGGHGAGT